MSNFITRFAPSPNGYLHLGHAYSALLGAHLAQKAGGRFLLRIEDIDIGRARPHFIEAIYDDLHWLGLNWEAPVMQQSHRFRIYEAALKTLRDKGLVYQCWARRSEIRAHIEAQAGGRAAWPVDPDGTPLYPGLYRDMSEAKRRALIWQSQPYAWRLDMAKAMDYVTAQHPDGLYFTELCYQPGRVQATPEIYGDIVLARKDIPTSYHLAVVVDDAAQNISHVTRGEDLYAATHIHVLLQYLLHLPTPQYYHHPLIRDKAGRRLSKQAGDEGFRALRQEGVSPQQIKAILPVPIGLA